mgnify:CR=1 FL=1
MLIHELSSAIQQDRERAVNAAMTARRHLWGACRPADLVSRTRAALRGRRTPSHPRVPTSQPDLRPTR